MLVLWFLVAVPPPGDTYASVRGKSLVVATECTYPPHSYRDTEGNIIGFDVELMREVAVRAKITVTFKCHIWETIFQGLLDGEYDAVASGVAITDERRKIMDFSASIKDFYLQFMEPIAAKHAFYDVPNLVIGVQRDTTHDYYISEHYKNSKIFRYDNFKPMLEGLRNNEVDVIFMDPLQAFFYLGEKNDASWLKTFGPHIQDVKLTGYGTGFAIRHGEPELKRALDKAIASVIADGTRDVLLRKYFMPR